VADRKLRELEARWRETQSVEDEAAWMRARFRSGELELFPEALSERMQTREFWLGYLGLKSDDIAADDAQEEDEDEDQDQGDTTLTIHLPGQHRLELRIPRWLEECSLHLHLPGLSESYEVANSDGGHPFPHLLRWDELEHICQAAAILQGSGSEDGRLLLLLHRFAPICRDSDFGRAMSLLEAAWRNLGLLGEREIRSSMEQIDRRGSGFRWQRTPTGWRLQGDEQGEILSLRASEDFPSPAWSDLTQRATELCAGQPSARLVPATIAPRLLESSYLTLTCEDDVRSLPDAFGPFLAEYLSHVFGDLDLGEVWLSGTGARTLFLLVRACDASLAHGLIAQAVLWAKAPRPAELELTEQPLVLRLGQLEAEVFEDDGVLPPGFFTLTQGYLERWQRDGLASALASLAAEEPDAEGWRQVPCVDHGALKVCARTLDSDECEGLTIVIDRSSPAASASVWRLAQRSGLHILPLGLAVSIHAEDYHGPWPTVRRVSPPELEDILEAGPEAWWSQA